MKLKYKHKNELSFDKGKIFRVRPNYISEIKNFIVLDTESTLKGHAKDCNWFCFRFDLPFLPFTPITKEIYNKYNISFYDKKENCYSIYWEGSGKDYILLTLKNIAQLCFDLKIKPFIYCHNLNYDIGAVLLDKEKILSLNPIMSGSRLIEVKYPNKITEKYITKIFKKEKERYKVRTVFFLNSFALLTTSVKELGLSLGLEKMDGGFNTKLNSLSPIPNEIDQQYVNEIYSNIQENYHPLTEKDKNYCRRDVDITYNSLLEFFKMIKTEFKTSPTYWTIASNSKRIIQTFLPEEMEKLGIEKNKNGSYILKKFYQLERMAYLSYAGGKTESYLLGRYKNVKEIDINSAYPKKMQEIFPSPLSKHYKKIKGSHYDFPKDKMGFCWVEIDIPKKTKYPILFIRTDRGVYYPTGKIKGYFSSEEINLAVKQGGTIKNFQGFFTSVGWFPLREFSKLLYKKRQEIKKNIKENKIEDCREYMLKILLNAGYGKFSEREKENGIVVYRSCNHFTTGFCKVCEIEVNKPTRFIQELNEEIEKFVPILNKDYFFKVLLEHKKEYEKYYRKFYPIVLERWKVNEYGNYDYNSIEIWERKYGVNEEIKKEFKELTVMKEHTLYSIASWITAKVRCFLTEKQMKLNKLGNKIIQSDTDSIYYVGKYKAEKTIEIGEWNLEGFYGWVQSYAPKDYSKLCDTCNGKGFIVYDDNKKPYFTIEKDRYFFENKKWKHKKIYEWNRENRQKEHGKEIKCEKCFGEGIIHVIKGVSKGAKINRKTGQAISLFFTPPKTADKKDLSVGEISYLYKQMQYDFKKRYFYPNKTSRAFTVAEIDELTL